jgi:hypothetical protein
MKVMPNLLNNTATIHLKGKWENVAFHSVGQYSFLYLGTVLEQLLDYLNRISHRDFSFKTWNWGNIHN